MEFIVSSESRVKVIIENAEKTTKALSKEVLGISSPEDVAEYVGRRFMEKDVHPGLFREVEFELLGSFVRKDDKYYLHDGAAKAYYGGNIIVEIIDNVTYYVDE